MTIAAANARFALTLATALVECGDVRDVVISPGSRNTPLVLAFDAVAREHGDLRLHVVLDERSAGFVAVGVAKASHMPVILACTSGSAAANYLPAVVEASQTGVPLIVLTADRPRELHDCGAPQTIDQTDIFSRFVRWSFAFAEPTPAASETASRAVVTMAARAISTAVGVNSGPVHLNCPFVEPLWSPDVPFEVPRDEIPDRRFFEPWLMPDEETIRDLADDCHCEPRGAIVVGPLAGRNSSLAAVVDMLAARLNWPVLADPLSNLRFDLTAHGHMIAGYDAALRDAEFAERMRPNIVLQIGAALTSKVANQWLTGVPQRVLIDSAGNWHDFSHTAHQLIIAIPAAVLRAIHQRIAGAKSVAESAAHWLRDWLAIDSAMRDEVVAPLISPDAGTLWEGAVARLLVENLPANANLHVASSMPVRDIDTYAPAVPQGIRIFGNRGANGIDGTFSTALGEALANPGTPTVLLTGELAFLHDVGSLVTAQRLAAKHPKLNLTAVVIDNGGGGIFEFLPIAQHDRAVFDSYFLTPHAANFEAIANAFGARFTRADSHADFCAAITACVERPGIDIVHVPIDRAHNVAMHRRAIAAVGERLRELFAARPSPEISDSPSHPKPQPQPVPNLSAGRGDAP